MLATGGIDNLDAQISPLTSLSQVSMPIYIVLTIVALFLVKGRVRKDRTATDVALGA